MSPFFSQNSDISLSPDHRNIIWNSRQGFTVRSPTFFYIAIFFCETSVNNVTYKSRSYLVYRPGQCDGKQRTIACQQTLILILPLFSAVNNIFDVKLNSSEPVKALKGQRLVLNCTATAELNSRANISWDYPGKVRTRLLYLPLKGVNTAFTHSTAAQKHLSRPATSPASTFLNPPTTKRCEMKRHHWDLDPGSPFY